MRSYIDVSAAKDRNLPARLRRMARACMGVHVLSSTTTVVGVGWFSMAMCVVYVDAWSHAMCHAPAHVRARTSREGGTDSPSRPLFGR